MNRRMTIATLAVALLAAISAPVRADQKADDTLRAADANWNKVFNAKDLDKSVAACTPTASILAPNAPRATGHEAIRALFAGFHALPELSIIWKPTEVRIARAGDIGYTSGTYEMSFKSPAGPVNDHGKYMTVWEKQGNEWRVVLDAFNSDLPVPTAAK